jgi:hypothetical protein
MLANKHGNNIIMCFIICYFPINVYTVLIILIEGTMTPPFLASLLVSLLQYISFDLIALNTLHACLLVSLVGENWERYSVPYYCRHAIHDGRVSFLAASIVRKSGQKVMETRQTKTDKELVAKKKPDKEHAEISSIMRENALQDTLLLLFNYVPHFLLHFQPSVLITITLSNLFSHSSTSRILMRTLFTTFHLNTLFIRA